MSFELGEKRVIVVDEKNLLIRDERTRKFANLTPQRWARLLECREQVNAAIEDILKKDDAPPVNFKRHIGGAWFISVQTGIWCVDIRKHYKAMDTGEMRPSRTGIGLRIREWRNLIETTVTIEVPRPDLVNVVLCYLQEDHQNQEGLLSLLLLLLLLPSPLVSK